MSWNSLPVEIKLFIFKRLGKDWKSMRNMLFVFRGLSREILEYKSFFLEILNTLAVKEIQITNGRKISLCALPNGMKHGVYKEFCFTTGVLLLKCNYKKGKLNGKYTKWGVVTLLENKENSLKYLKSRRTYKDGKLNGKYRKWSIQKKMTFTTPCVMGQLIKKCAYKNNLLDGKYETWRVNGALLETIFYSNGLLLK